jgi:hypothetical protein
LQNKNIDEKLKQNPIEFDENKFNSDEFLKWFEFFDKKDIMLIPFKDNIGNIAGFEWKIDGKKIVFISDTISKEFTQEQTYEHEYSHTFDKSELKKLIKRKTP